VKVMMGERQVDQGALFYEFSLERQVPADHMLHSIDRFVDLGAVRTHLDRFEERHWRRMEEALARTVERHDHAPASPRMPVVRPSARQVIHSGYMAR
jgi:hypothetical protein